MKPIYGQNFYTLLVICALLACWPVVYYNYSIKDLSFSGILTESDSDEPDKRTRHFHSQLHCYNKEHEPRIELRSNKYWVLYNYVRGSRSFACDESVTYTTHSDYTYLDNLVPLLRSWNGPISICLYAPGTDYKATLEAIMYYRQCDPDYLLVQELVTFHMFLPASRMAPQLPNSTILTQQQLLSYKLNCTTFNITGHLQRTSYKKQHDLDYPVNVARNVARQMAMTHFVFASDIELYPSPNVIPQFLDMIRSNEPILQLPNKRVYVLPIFEIYPGNKIPEVKSELIQGYKNGSIIIFHENFCRQCHAIPQLNDWIEDSDPGKDRHKHIILIVLCIYLAFYIVAMGITHIARRAFPHHRWEPIYIGTNEDPLYDERLSWEGRNDKMTQSLQLCLLKYDFYILSNAWLLHRPGVKLTSGNQTRRMELQENIIRYALLPEITWIYGEREGCVWKDWNG